MKRLTLTTVLLLLILLTLSSCKKETPPENEAESIMNVKLTGVYSISEVEVPEGYVSDLLSTPSHYDGRFTATVLKLGVRGRQVHTVTFDENGENAVIDDISAVGEIVNEGTFVTARFMLSDGCRAASEKYSSEDLMELYLTAHDENGSLLFNIDIAEVFNYNMNRDIGDLTGLGFEVNSVVSAEHNGETLYIVLTTEGICALDKTGAVRWKNTSQRTPVSIASIDLGVLYLSGDTMKQTLRFVNLDDGSLGDHIELPETILSTNDHSDFPTFILGEGYDFYVKNRLALWGITLEKAEDGTIDVIPTEVLNWFNSDIPENDVHEMCIVSPQLMLATYRDPTMSGAAAQALLLMKMIPEDELVEKQIIKLAALDTHTYLGNAVAKYNRQSTTHRIVVTDFLQYDEDARKTRFDAAIAGGNPPDIVLINSSAATESYMKNGIFADLTPLMKADETFDYDDLLGSVTKPFMLYDGKQQIFPTSAGFMTLIGSAKQFDGPITPDEMIEMHNSLGGDKWLMQTNDGVREALIAYSFNEFIDYGTASCTFDDPRFVSLIAPDITEHEYPEEFYSQKATLRNFLYGDTLLYEYGSMNLQNWVLFSETIEGGIVNVGYPNTQGITAVDKDIGGFAVLENSPFKKEAIDFLEIFISQAASQTLHNAQYFRKSDIDRDLESYDNVTVIIDGISVSALGDAYVEDSKPGLRVKVTKEHAEQLKAFYDNVDAAVRPNTQAREMYNDEFNSNPDRSAEEIADVFSSRVSVYLAEQFG